MDSCTVGGSVKVNKDVVDAEMNESGNMVEGKQETKIATDESNNGDNANTEEIKQDESESGKVARRSGETSDSTTIRTEHSSLPLHRCMRIIPHDQNSGAFFIAVLQKLSPLNGIFHPSIPYAQIIMASNPIVDAGS